MAAAPETKPVEDSIAKVNDEFAVGSDLPFQAKWMRVERIVWVLLTIFIFLNIAGVFGRGPVAHARMRASDGSLNVGYERIERFSTPSVMTVEFGPNAVRDGTVQLWVSDSLVKPLGNQRVVPQPLRSTIGQGGILYTFPVISGPISVEFSLQPTKVGLSPITLRVPGMAEVAARIFVMP